MWGTESAPETPRKARSMARLERRERVTDSLSWGRVLFRVRIWQYWLYPVWAFVFRLWVLFVRGVGRIKRFVRSLRRTSIG